MYAVRTCRDSTEGKKRYRINTMIFFFFLSKRLRGRNRRLKSQHFHLSKYQHNTGESPTSQPRINKGDLWQGRERKKRGEGDVRSFPSQKVPTETGDWEQSCPSDSSTQNRLLRLFPFRKEKKKKKEGETGCCQLDHRKLYNETAVFSFPRDYSPVDFAAANC